MVVSGAFKRARLASPTGGVVVVIVWCYVTSRGDNIVGVPVMIVRCIRFVYGGVCLEICSCVYCGISLLQQDF